MSNKYQEYKSLDLPGLAKEMRSFWEAGNIFQQSLDIRRDAEPFVFYEGPPSANGVPGIHHVMARTIKDLFCRYQTQKGRFVERKAGWDTHGLPVEISVEKTMGITKEDIGTKISVEDYNKACRKEVMKYKDLWDELTREMGYWVDLENPYITFDNEYIESVWHLLSSLYQKGLLYKGYTIQPYSPAAGTGLSTHELNQPGCYRDVKDTTVVAQFELVQDEKFKSLFVSAEKVYMLAWTTTPWTLPSNTALAVGNKLEYLLVSTFNPYTSEPIRVILAKELFRKYFPESDEKLLMEDYKTGNKNIPYTIVDSFTGNDLEGLEYHQLFPWVKPMGAAFRVITGDFVTTEEGTGIVHIAPTFGADDDRVAKQSGIVPLVLIDRQGERRPMVDLQGRFFRMDDLDEDFVAKYVNRDLYATFAGRYVKNAFDKKLSDQDPSLDVDLAVDLKKHNKAFRIEKYVHNYPHCWRTDKPVLYYPLDSWFIKTTELKNRMQELNKTINWKPASTGVGRFGNWLENLVDWNLSRSRFWGVPLPIWTTEDKSEQVCIGSVEQLKQEIEKSMAVGFMDNNPLETFTPGNFSKENYQRFDLHRPYADRIVLVSDSGKKMYREPDLIDVWFDSGSMPYAQFHYPFENPEIFRKNFPADFIAEGVDQTRGWFFTLHAIAVMLFDSVAFKTVVSNGLVLDKSGNKMSKRLGNAVDPFETIEKYGPDATRWYMITNAQPWDNLKFDLNGVDEVRRKFFGTLHNTYAFFALYANIDGFSYREKEVPLNERPEIDRWILSELNSLIAEVDLAYGEYEPTRAGRAIQYFLDEHLSNWYVRLSRRRFWKGSYSQDKIAAYQTLYRCLEVMAMLGAPIAPFYMDRLYQDLNRVSGRNQAESVHLSDFPVSDPAMINHDLEERMELAHNISSMALSLRKKNNIRVRQPLQKIMIPVKDKHFREQIMAVEQLILQEVNVKELEYLPEDSGILVKKIKPDYKKLGPKYGKKMKAMAAAILDLGTHEINQLEQNRQIEIMVNQEPLLLLVEDVEILTEDIPGWSVSTMDQLTVALDITITEPLLREGLARELINRVQNIRKEKDLEVTDRIRLIVKNQSEVRPFVEDFTKYIEMETLSEIQWVQSFENENSYEVDLAGELKAEITISKI